MANKINLTMRIDATMRERVQKAAAAQLVTESTWLRQAILAALGTMDAAEVSDAALQSNTLRDKRLSVRLRPDDRLLLTDRARARGMAPAT